MRNASNFVIVSPTFNDLRLQVQACDVVANQLTLAELLTFMRRVMMYKPPMEQCWQQQDDVDDGKGADDTLGDVISTDDVSNVNDDSNFPGLSTPVEEAAQPKRADITVLLAEVII